MQTSIIIFIMRKSQLKLNQLVSAEQIKRKRVGQVHKVSNSLKRNKAYRQAEPERANQQYQCRLPQVGFCRKDLSLILRFIMFKQNLQIADRNLLRRILLSNFDEEVIVAGTKKFIHFLKMLEGNGKLDPLGKNLMYFLLKGKGQVKSGDFDYQVKPGFIFGQIQMLTGITINQVSFQGKFLILTLEESDFNTFYRGYFQKKYSETLGKMRCIHQVYLSKAPQMARYLFLASIYQKTFSPGQQITKEGQKIKQIFFVNLGQKMNKSLSCENCFGLSQIVRSEMNYSETVKCTNKKVCLPCVKVQDFQRFILAYSQSNISVCGENNSGIGIELNLSCLSFHHNQPQPRPHLKTFMKVKKVKLPNSQLRSRLKTEPTIIFETNFKFLKPQRLNSGFKNRQRESRYQRYKSSLEQRISKSLLNYSLM